jgi:hypothetical protein
MKSLIFTFFLFAQNVYSQFEMDTLKVEVKFCKMKDRYNIGSHRMNIKKENNILITDYTKIIDSIIICLNHQNSGYLFLKIYHRNRLFATGEWNESGFQNIVSYYDRKGRMKKQCQFDNGNYIKFLNKNILN